MTFTVNPFNSALGTLDSFTFAWVLSMTGDGVGAGPSGFLSISYGGTAYVNADSYGGGGNGDSRAGDGVFSQMSKSTSLTHTYLPANAGVTYNPAFLTVVTGGSTFGMTFKSGSGSTASASYSSVVSATSTYTTGLTVTYNYTAAVPEPSFAVVGLALAAGTVVVRRRRAARHAA